MTLTICLSLASSSARFSGVSKPPPCVSRIQTISAKGRASDSTRSKGWRPSRLTRSSGSLPSGNMAKRSDWLLYYPVVINLTMLALFSYSLYQGPSMIERLARLKEPDLPDEAIGYLKKVTLLWCGLFILNGSMAAYTAAFTSLATWTLYNGLIAYVLMGLLLGGEWLYRSFWLKKT